MKTLEKCNLQDDQKCFLAKMVPRGMKPFSGLPLKRGKSTLLNGSLQE